jgi:DNA-binding Xre family transcriptional regulator
MLKSKQTKLDRFCATRGIRTSELARAAGVSRKHVSNIRHNKVRRVGLVVGSKIAAACKTLSNETVAIEDLFELRKAS